MRRLFSSILLCSILINGYAFDYDSSFLPEIKPKITEQCYKDMAGGGTHLREFIIDAVSVWNAKTPGSMNGSHDYTGDFEGCLRGAENGALRKYCVIDVVVTYEDAVLTRCNQDGWLGHITCPYDGFAIAKYTLKWSLCTVGACSESDIRTMAEVLVQKSDIGRAGLAFEVSLPKNGCQTSAKRSFGTNAIMFFALIGAIVGIVTVCTTWHSIHNMTSHKPAPVLVRNWSLIENFASLTESSTADIKVLHSLRVITIWSMILAHQSLFVTNGPMLNLDYYLFVIGVIRTDLLVDSCFTMGAFIATSNFLNSKDKHFIDLALNRYFRYAPILAIIIFYVTSMMEYTGRGPFWPIIASTERDTCMKYWLPGLLLLGNYCPWSEHCWIVSWYIPADFHFYLVGVILCRLLKKNPKRGLLVVSLLLTISILLVGFTVAYNEWIVTMSFMTDGMRDIRTVKGVEPIYNRSHFRISSYLVGMLGGYLSYVWTQRKMVMSKRAVIQGFLSSITILVLIVISTTFYGTYNPVKAAFYGSLLRPLWSLAFVLFTLTFMFGKIHFSKMAYFFEMKMWVPLSKLTFCMYMMHMAVVYRTIGSQVQPFLYGGSTMFIRVVVDLSLTFIGALVLYLCVEKPSNGLFKLSLKKYRSWGNPKSNNCMKLNYMKNGGTLELAICNILESYVVHWCRVHVEILEL